LNNYDFFGNSIANLGDLNGDGIQDVMVGASGDIYFTGAVFVLFMNRDGTVKNTQCISNISGNLNVVLNSNDHFGNSISNLGDLNGDGVTDVIVGAYGDTTNTGAVYVLFLNNDGTVQSTQKISATSGNLNIALKIGDFFGFSVANIGYLNQNGILYVIVGAYGTSANKGAVYLLSLNTAGEVQNTLAVTSTSGNLNVAWNPNVFFGCAVANIGDLNGNGFQDVMVGAYGDNADTGAVYVLFLNLNTTQGSTTTQGTTTTTQGSTQGTTSSSGANIVKWSSLLYLLLFVCMIAQQ